MIFAVVFIVILLAVARQGGDLRRLGDVRLRHPSLVLAALVIQFTIGVVVAESLPAAVAGGLHIASYGLAFAFVWLNRRVAGILLIVAGGLMNLTAIAANDGVMPASAAAVEFAGIEQVGEGFRNSAVRDDPNLLWLGDVFALPDGLPFANVFSVGDVVLLVGGYVFVSRACRHHGSAAADPSRLSAAGEAAVVATAVAGAPVPGRAGWYPDPESPGLHRWWDGAGWTTRVAQLRPLAPPVPASDSARLPDPTSLD